MNYEKLKEAIYRCLSSITEKTNRQLIRSDQDGHRPNPPFATYRFDINAINDFNEERYNFSDASIKNISRSEITVSLQFFGNGSYSHLSNARGTMRLQSFRDRWKNEFNTLGVCIDFKDTGDITNLTQVLSTNFEERAQMDIVFSMTDAIIDEGYCEENLNYNINKFNVVGEIKKHNADDEPIIKEFTIIEGQEEV